MVMGVSAGAGKSTFARKLGELLEINVYHLDTLYWKPNWIEASLEEFVANQEEIVTLNEWIIEGNYSHTYDIRVGRADTIIYIEPHLMICLFRVLKRRILNHGKTRPDMGEGCPEKLDFPFLTFICTTYFSRKKMMRTRLDTLRTEKNIVLLRNNKEMKQYLKGLKANISAEYRENV